MYTYVQQEGARKKIRPRMYIRAGSRTPIRAYIHGWVGTEKQRRRHVHGKATECVVFIGRQQNVCEQTGWFGTECMVVFIGRAWTEQAMETRPGVPHNEGNGPPTFRTGSFDWEGCGVPQNGGNRPPTVETGVLLIGRGVAYRKTDETDLLRSKWGSC